MMDNFSVGGPHSVFDWAAIRDEFREKLDLLDLESMAILYGLSRTYGYRDDDFARRVEDFLNRQSDPIRVRFEFAYQVGSSFWETYELWGMDNVQPGEPGYIGELLGMLHKAVLGWVLDGLSSYSDVPEVMDNAYFLVSRIGNYDTFLEEGDIPLMEAAAGKEISLNTSEGGRKLIEHLDNFFKEMNDKNKMDEDFGSYDGDYEEPE